MTEQKPAAGKGDIKWEFPMQRSNNNRLTAIFTCMGVLALMFAITVPTAFGDDDTTRLRARGQAAINGIETELRGDFRVEASPFRQRLSAELHNIHLPLGTPVAFCLVRSSGTLRLHRSKVHLESGIKVAELDLDTNDGNTVPDVHVGDRIETHQARVAPFNPTPTCGSPLLVSAKFQ